MSIVACNRVCCHCNHRLSLQAFHVACPALTQVAMVGSSGGAFIAVFARCGVAPLDAVVLAHQLVIKHGVLARPLGLLGVWGGERRHVTGARPCSLSTGWSSDCTPRQFHPSTCFISLKAPHHSSCNTALSLLHAGASPHEQASCASGFRSCFPRMPRSSATPLEQRWWSHAGPA